MSPRTISWPRRAVGWHGDALRIAVGILLLNAGIMVVPGCQRSGDIPEPVDAPPMAAIAKNSTAKGQPAQPVHRTQKHDFGQVGVGSKCKHTFKITNRSNTPWTLKAIHTGCGCIVTEMSNKTIAPGATENLTLVFSAGERDGKYQQDVRVQFVEADAPLVRLQVSASVHRPLSCLPKMLVVNPVRVGTHEERFAKVCNFSGKKWDTLSVTNGSDWVKVQAHPNPNASDLKEEDAPLQVWNAALDIDGGKLSEGWNVATLCFSPAGDSKTADEVVVRAYRIPAVTVAPSMLFCGIVERGPELQKTLCFTFRDASEVPPVHEIKTTAERAPVTVRWRKDDKIPAVLLADATIRTTGETLTGELAIDFGKGRRLEIPVRGSFRDAMSGNEPHRNKKSS